MSDSPYIIVANAHNFTKAVLERSEEVPVLVDFWAEWCSPCKMLMPILSKLTEEYQGQFILAKVNTDEQRELAMQYGVHSLPTLKLFRRYKVVEEIVGVQPETVLRAMIDRHRHRPADKLRSQAAQVYASGNVSQALELLETAHTHDPTYYPIQVDIAKILIDSKKFKQAEELLKSLPANVQAENTVNKLLIKINFFSIAASAPPIEVLENKLMENPNDHAARYQLSAQNIMKGDYEMAMQHLLELMRRDRNFRDDIGRKGLLSVFTLLNNQGTLVNQYRSKMSSLLY